MVGCLSYAHLLLDDLFPAIAALDIFNIDVAHAHAAYYGCVQYTFDSGRITTTYDGITPLADACHANFKKYSKLVFGREATNMAFLEGQSQCFKQVIMGHGGSLNNRFVLKERGITLRKGRDLIIQNLNMTNNIPPSGLSVMVLTKPPTWPTLCADIETMVYTQLHLDEIPVLCVNPGDFALEDELELIQSATLLVAVHGTVSLLSLFARDGAILIAIGEEKETFKDGQTLLYATHIQTYFTTVERMDSLPSLIRYGLFLAASNFEIPFSSSAEHNIL